MVDIQWRWTLLVFALNFILSWLGFAVLWYLVAYSHGDIDHYAKTSQEDINDNAPNLMEDPNFKPCVTYIYGFTSAFLFSLETQHTIGKKYIKKSVKFQILFTCFYF